MLSSKYFNKTTLGSADEWKIYQLHDGQEFYCKQALGDYRWLKPIDAVEKDEADIQCTNITFDYKATEQPWYTSVWKSNLQPDFNVRVFGCFDTSTSAVLRELAESNRFVQKSAESTSI